MREMPELQQRFEIVRPLGSASVQLVRETSTGRHAVLKRLPLIERGTGRKIRAHHNEIQALRALRSHAHVVRLEALEIVDQTALLFTQHCESGDLLDYMVRRGNALSEAEARRFFTQICSAVHFAHSMGFVHRDLKLENIFLDRQLQVRVGDWGYASQWAPDKQLGESCGSLHYAAPEIFRGAKYCGPEVDCYSLGVLLYAMVCGRTPFEGTEILDIYRAVLRGRIEFPPFLSCEIQSLIAQLLAHDATQRASIHVILQHPWMTQQQQRQKVVEEEETTRAHLSSSPEREAVDDPTTTPPPSPATITAPAIAATAATAAPATEASPRTRQRRNSFSKLMHRVINIVGI